MDRYTISIVMFGSSEDDWCFWMKFLNYLYLKFSHKFIASDGKFSKTIYS